MAWSGRLQLYDLEDCNVWFIRFSLDETFSRMACGTNTGSVLIYDLQNPSKPKAKVTRPPGPGGANYTVQTLTILPPLEKSVRYILLGWYRL
jgi:hypothetical protein